MTMKQDCVLLLYFRLRLEKVESFLEQTTTDFYFDRSDETMDRNQIQILGKVNWVKS